MEAIPTFGTREEGRHHRRRRAVYGVALSSGGAEVAVLAVHGGHFLPGGGVEGGETPLACLVREVMEETGCAVTMGPFLGRARRYFNSRQGEPLLSDALFHGASLGARIREATDTDHRLLWVPTGDASRLLTHEHHAWAVARALTATRHL